MNTLTKVVLHGNADGTKTLMFHNEKEALNIKTFEWPKTKADNQANVGHCQLIAAFVGVPFIETSWLQPDSIEGTVICPNCHSRYWYEDICKCQN
jgi:hypothetical protein